MICPVCQHRGEFRTFAAREMMFGWRQPFTYAECPQCKSLHLVNVPGDIGAYYPAEYYSLAIPSKIGRKAEWSRRTFSRWVIGSRSRIAAVLAEAERDRYPFLHWARLCHAGLGTSFLDVGCGSGGMLYRMRRWGFTNLTGVDPFTKNPVEEPGLVIRKCELSATEGTFEVIMLHHVLEHLPIPAATLRLAAMRLAVGGRILVRLPLADSLAARSYGANWFNLDAPRHLVIPSKIGMLAIVASAGLRVETVEFDRSAHSFAMSECYRRDVSMQDGWSAAKKESRRFARIAREAEARGDGDLGLFVLTK